MILIVFTLLLLVSILKKRHYNLTNSPRDMIPTIETDCRFQPKKCPLGIIKCDCKDFCKNPDAKLLKLKRNYFCSIPYPSFECDKMYGDYIYDGVWKCIPKYPGVFSTSGDQIMGKYPFGDITKKNYNNCDGLLDEYGNKLLTVVLDRGVFFCLHDYCLNNIPKNPAKGYNFDSGLCECTSGTENLDINDKTSPCVTAAKYKDAAFKINCYKEDFYVKDMDKYLVQCPDDLEYIPAKKNK
jgi:hypothetical protein